MIIADIISLVAKGEMPEAICARDLPLPLKEASALLRNAADEGHMIRMTPGVYSPIRFSEVFQARIPFASINQVLDAYGRQHKRQILPSPALAVLNFGLKEIAGANSYHLWNGPERTLRVQTMPMGTIQALTLKTSPAWLHGRESNPITPFLLALSFSDTEWKAAELQKFARRTGPNLLRLILQSPRKGLPPELQSTLRRLKTAQVRIFGPENPPGDPMAIVMCEATRVSPPKPFDRCRSASTKLADTLTSKGVPSNLLRCRGHVPDRPHADHRWRRLSQAGWIHYVVHIPSLGIIVDPTWSQFDITAAPVRITNDDDYPLEWSEIQAA